MIKISTMMTYLSTCKQPQQPRVSFPVGPSTVSLKFGHKEKVVIVMGATGTGKSKLSIDLATRFAAEIVNSDKIQVFHGLDIVTNKVTPEECRGIPHHLLGIIDPQSEFSSTDFCRLATTTIDSIIEKDRLPIIAGGSNSLIDSLVNKDPYFNRRYECCFLWVDVSPSILRSFVKERVDRMIDLGMINEVRQLFDPKADYTKGIRKAIGLPEMHRFLEAERNCRDKETLSDLLEEAIDDIKKNSYKLACRQLQNIQRLRDVWGWNLYRIDATRAFMKRGRMEEANQAWEEVVVGPSTIIVDQFLNGAGYSSSTICDLSHTYHFKVVPLPAMAAATY